MLFLETLFLFLVTLHNGAIGNLYLNQQKKPLLSTSKQLETSIIILHKNMEHIQLHPQ